MKKLIILISIVITSCGNDEVHIDKKADTTKSTNINKDSLRRVENTIAFHWKKYKQVYGRLEIDSLKVDSSESYRIVVSHSWGSNEYGGQPTSIMFRKSRDSCYAIITDLYVDSTESELRKTKRLIPCSSFDTIRAMFDKGAFWKHPLTTTDAKKISTDPDYTFFEAVKNGKHKLVSTLHEIDSIPLLQHWNWQYNFYHYSHYSTLFEEDMEWYKKHPSPRTGYPPSFGKDRRRQK